MPDPTNNPQEENSRQFLGRFVVYSGVGGTLALGLVVLAIGRNLDSAKFALNALLPLLATWVGTILAFYFSRENFAAANKAVREMAQSVTGLERLKSIPVAVKMRPVDQITFLTVKPGSEAQTLLADVLTTFKDLPRILILNEDKSVRFLIYRSMIDRFISSQALSPPVGAAPAALRSLTLNDLLASPINANKLFENSFVFVSEDATLGDAKLKMDAVRNCNDVFVTKTGDRVDPLRGWITDNTISEYAKV